MLMEDKANALQLYNAMNDSNYTDPDLVEMHTLDKGVSLTVRNDAAFVVDASLSIYEHQSTVCPNMQVRCLMYFANILHRLLKNRNIYGKSLIRIPVPKFAVLYNGEESQPEQYDMKLSDAFEKKVEIPEAELICHVYNINHGYNESLMKKCPILQEYMTFVTYVREYHKQEGYENLEIAINNAIDRCIEEDILRDFLVQNRSEVIKVTQMDYTFDRQITLTREESIEEGELKCLITLVLKKLKKNLSVEAIADQLEIEKAVVSRIRAAADLAGTQDVEAVYQRYLEVK